MAESSSALRSYSGKIARIVLHVGFWLFFFAFSCYYNAMSPDAFQGTPAKYLSAMRSTLSAMLIYYPLMYLIFPGFLLRKKYLLFAIGLVCCVVLYTFIDYALEWYLYKSCTSCSLILKQTLPDYFAFLQTGPWTVVTSRLLSLAIIYQFLAFISLPVGIRLGRIFYAQSIRTLRLQKDNLQLQKDKLQLERDNLQLEFDFLKSQVNPHFLFNTLNNLYGLILQDRKEDSAESVARLSDFMRYTLYNCNGNKNSLNMELKLLQDYVLLEQLRLNHALVNFTYDIDDGPYELPPLLFLPLVENAFKFCSQREGGWVTLKITLKKSHFVFRISNSTDTTEHELKRQSDTRTSHKAGIGTINFVKRMEYFYSGIYSYEVRQDESEFIVEVEIEKL